MTWPKSNGNWSWNCPVKKFDLLFIKIMRIVAFCTLAKKLSNHFKFSPWVKTLHLLLVTISVCRCISYFTVNIKNEHIPSPLIGSPYIDPLDPVLPSQTSKQNQNFSLKTTWLGDLANFPSLFRICLQQLSEL